MNDDDDDYNDHNYHDYNDDDHDDNDDYLISLTMIDFIIDNESKFEGFYA